MPRLCLQIKSSLLTWLQQDCTVEQQALPPFLRNKLAQAIVGVVKAEYPTVWPNFFRSAAEQPCQNVVIVGSAGLSFASKPAVGLSPAHTLHVQRPHVTVSV